MTRRLAALLLTLSLAGCGIALGGIPKPKQTPTMVRLMEQDFGYLRSAADFPERHDHDAPLPVQLAFTLTAAENESAWPRAEQWLVEQAQVQVRAKTSGRVASVLPVGRGFHYTVERSRGSGAADYTVTCDVSSGLSSPSRTVARQADKNCHFLAWYLKSGDSRPSRVSVTRSAGGSP